MSMLTVWTLWEIMSVTVLQDTLEMEHTALVNSSFLNYKVLKHFLIGYFLPAFRCIIIRIFM